MVPQVVSDCKAALKNYAATAAKLQYYTQRAKQNNK